MAYKATVIEVMIASPSDVEEERNAVRQGLHEWNAGNASATQTVLLPVGWETHAAPDLAGRAQGLINERVLARCDLLVGVFWTRLGTPTGEHESGTVEEIKKHVASGRTAMVYFSSKPIVPGSIDARQYRKVTSFKKWCQGQGLIENFESVADFQRKFGGHLARILRDSPYLQSLMPQSSSSVAPSSELRTVQLDEIAVKMLQTAVRSDSAMVVMHRSLDGTSFQAGDQGFETGGSRREEARLQAAVKQLEDYGLIRDLGHKGEVFEVTHEGFEAIDRLESSVT